MLMLEGQVDQISTHNRLNPQSAASVTSKHDQKAPEWETLP